MSIQGWSYFLAILLQVILAEAQDIQFEVSLSVLNYQNPSNRDSNNQCCTGSGRNCGNLPCNNLFLLCAGPQGQTRTSNRVCPFGSFNFTRNDDDITSVEVPNPFVFRGRQGIPEELEFIIEVNNTDMATGTGPLVDRFDLVGTLLLNTNFTRTFNGLPGIADITMTFLLTCSENYFGSDCDTYCVPTEQFTCNPENGSIICREGYQNETTNCSSCVPAAGCNTTNAFCTAPGECICLPGFTGELCDTPGFQTGTSRGSGLSQGGVAGIVIVVLILVALIIAGVVLGILFWVYQPWSNGWFGLEAIIMKNREPEDAIENPVYEVETVRNRAPPVRGIKYIPTATEATSNGHANTAAASVDEDNPLYASSALEKILNPGESNGTRNKNVVPRKPPSENGRTAANGHAQLNGKAVKQLNYPAIGTLRESSSLENVLMTVDVTSPKELQPPTKKEERSKKRNSLPDDTTPKGTSTTPTASGQAAQLMASQSVDNLLGPGGAGNFLNPYGEYSDQTLQRAVSGNSFNAEDEDEDSERVFDNPDYEVVLNESINSDKPIDDDYEQI